jgi:phosphinothricin acetyltransferase
METMKNWFQLKEDNNFPVIGAVNEEDQFMGFASYGSFRPYPANQYTIEHSIYVHPDHRGKSVASFLLGRLIEKAKEQEYHCMIGGIDATNEASIRLHEKFGFESAGVLKQVGFKFGKWLDLAFYQLILRKD